MAAVSEAMRFDVPVGPDYRSRQADCPPSNDSDNGLDHGGSDRVVASSPQPSALLRRSRVIREARKACGCTVIIVEVRGAEFHLQSG